MGYIKEPEGINFVVENKGLSDDERLLINQIIERGKVKRRKKRLPTTKKSLKVKELAKKSQ